MNSAIEMRGVRKAFGKKVAVEGMDLRVAQGELLGIIGPNGAGKSTTIRMIMSILFPDSGSLEVLGKASAVESKDRIGYLPEERGVYKKMKVGDFLRHMGRLKGAPAAGLDGRIAGWMERVKLPGVLRKKCEELSKGMQQKVQFVAAVLHEPDLLILDEPFSGLDPVNMRLLRTLIGELNAAGTTVLFSTHVMAHAEQVCDHVVMIHEGRKVLDGPLDRIRADYDTRTIAFDPAGGADRFDPAALGDVAGITGYWRDRRGRGGWEAGVAAEAEPTAALAALARAVPVSRIELHRPSLEDIFVSIVVGDGGDEAERVRASLHAGGGGIEGEAGMSAVGAGVGEGAGEGGAA